MPVSGAAVYRAGARRCKGPARPSLDSASAAPLEAGGHGAVAQLGERGVRNAEVRGSIPSAPPNLPQTDDRQQALRRASC